VKTSSNYKGANLAVKKNRTNRIDTGTYMMTDDFYKSMKMMRHYSCKKW